MPNHNYKLIMSFRLKIFGFELELRVSSATFEEAEKFVKKLLAERLKPEFTFHNLQHTLNVMDAASQLSVLEKVSDKEKEIVRLAALFHDTGFTRVYNFHEDESIHIASTYLTKYGYPKEDMEQVVKCIQSTKRGAEAQSKLEMIIQDADMAHLASEHYFSLLPALRKELKVLQDQDFTDEEWFKQNLDFLLSHSYKTDSAKMLWDESKKKNVQANKQLVIFL